MSTAAAGTISAGGDSGDQKPWRRLSSALARKLSAASGAASSRASSSSSAAAARLKKSSAGRTVSSGPGKYLQTMEMARKRDSV